MYRFSEHSLAIERGRRRKTWLSREDRLCAHCHIRDTYFPQIKQTHKELKFPYLSEQQDLWPVVTRKGQPVKNKHHLNTTHIYVKLFSLLCINYLHIVTTLYIAIIWVSVYYIFQLLWQWERLRVREIDWLPHCKLSVKPFQNLFQQLPLFHFSLH
jgi:hypothetical protein